MELLREHVPELCCPDTGVLAVRCPELAAGSSGCPCGFVSLFPRQGV